MRVGQQLCRYARAAESGPRNAVARARLTLTTVLLLGLVTLGAQTPAVAQVQPGPFSCATPTAFLAQDSPTTMLAQEYGDGEVTYTPVGPNATSEWHYNAIGFRPVDEYIYAISGDLDVAHPPGHLLQIDSTGAVTDLGAVAGDPNLQTENIFRGAFDDAGFFYVGVPTGTGGELTIDRIDVTASPPSVTSSTPLTARMQANDFTFANGFLWALARATANPAVIYRIDAVSGRVDEFTAPVQIEADGSYGGAWTYGNGNLGFSANQSGNVHQISVANPSSASPTFSLVSTNSGPGSGNNDGTSCVPDPADLRLAKSASPVRVAPGGQVAFTLVVTNNGPGISSGWVVDDQVPGEMTNVASSTPGCSVTGNLVRCLGGTLGVGQSRTIRITATAPATPETTVTNTGSVFGNEEDENPLNNQASADVTTEPVSDVSIVKTAPTEALVNETVTYTLRVTNDGPSSATGVVVSDPLPTGLSSPQVTTTKGTCDATVTCVIGGMAPNEVVTITIDATAEPSAARTTVENTATVTRNEQDPTPGNDTSTTRTAIEPVADVSIVKEGPPQAAANERITYTLTVTNNGPNSATGVVVSDPLPAELSSPQVTTTKGTCDTTVTCAIGGMAPNEFVTITIDATAEPSAARTTVENTATVTRDEHDPTPGNDTSTTRTDVTPVADLSIDKTADQQEILVGDTITYTLEVKNNGPSSATGVVVSDPLPAGLSSPQVTTTKGTCDATVTCTIGGMVPDEVVTITIAATADTAAGRTTIVNTARVTGDDPDPDTGNNISTTATDVEPVADLSVEKTADRDEIFVGETITYTLIARNGGPNSADLVVVRDELPEHLEAVDATPSKGDCTVAAREVECDLGTLAVNEEAAVEIVARALTAAGGTTVTNVGTITGTDRDRDPDDNRSQVPTQVNELSDLAIEKVAEQSSVQVGETLSYLLTVSNAGPSAARDVTVTDDLPADATLLSAEPSAGTCEFADPVTCSIGSVAAGGTVVIRISVQPTAAGTLVNTAGAQSPVQDPDGSDNDDRVETPVSNPPAGPAAPPPPPPETPRADLPPPRASVPPASLSKRASRSRVRRGRTVLYTITYRNRGRTTARRVTICDRLPRDLTFVRASGRERFSRGRVCWTRSSVRPRRAFRVRIRLRVDENAARSVRNTAYAWPRGGRRAWARSSVRTSGRVERRGGGVTG